jgi:hypothetical protein
MSCFSFLSFISSKKSWSRRAEQVLLGEGGWYQWEREVVGKRSGRVKKCVHMHVNAKMIPTETISGIEGGFEFKYDILDTL